MPNGFELLEKLTLSDRLVQQIEDRVLEGQLKPGMKLPTEASLAEQFGVGRTTVREALKVLESRGLVERSHSGTFVADVAASNLAKPLVSYIVNRTNASREIYEARKALEVQIAELASQRATEEDLDKIEAEILAAERLRADQHGAHLAADIAFHLAVADAARNAVLLEIYSVVLDVMQRVFARVYDRAHPELFKWAASNHRSILEALRNRDSETAKAEVKRVLQESESLIQPMLDESESKLAEGVNGP